MYAPAAADATHDGDDDEAVATAAATTIDAVYLWHAIPGKRHIKSFSHFSPAAFTIAKVVISVFATCISMAHTHRTSGEEEDEDEKSASRVRAQRICDGEKVIKDDAIVS